MNQACYYTVKAALEHMPERRRVVEFGSADVNGNVRDLLGDAEYIGVDIRPGPNVDVVADAATYDPPWRPDLVLCLNMLEHTEDGPAIVANAHRMLAPSGALMVSVPDASFPIHSADGGALKEGEWYKAFDVKSLWQLLGAFADTVFTANGQLIYAIGVRGNDISNGQDVDGEKR